MNYYERHLGDYARDTGHLTVLEHGVYTLLLDRYYATESGIPQEISEKICRARSRDERAAVASVLREFFRLIDGVWVNDRAEGEIAAARVRIDSARANGKKGGRPTTKPNGKPEITQPVSTGLLLGSENETQTKALQAPSSKLQAEDKQEQPETASTATPSTSPIVPATADAKAARAQRLAQVTDEAVETFNESRLVKTRGGLVANVSARVGREKRLQHVGRCLRVAKAICVENYDSQTVIREFWSDYWAACFADEHKSGRKGGGKDHPNWLPSFEYLTREETMLEVYDRAASEAMP